MNSVITVTDLHVFQQLLSVEHTLWVGIIFMVKTWEIVTTIMRMLAEAKSLMYGVKYSLD